MWSYIGLLGCGILGKTFEKANLYSFSSERKEDDVQYIQCVNQPPLRSNTQNRQGRKAWTLPLSGRPPEETGLGIAEELRSTNCLGVLFLPKMPPFVSECAFK